MRRLLHLSTREYWCYIRRMAATPLPGRLGAMPPHPGFRYIAGDVALDFVNTVVWAAGGLGNERLRDYDSLTRWAEGAGVVPQGTGAGLRRIAARQPRQAAATLRRARALRDTVRRVFQTVAGTGAPGPALEALDRAVADTLRHHRLRPSRGPRSHGAAAEWCWSNADERLDSPLWPVALAAAELLVSEEAANVKTCGGAECGWMFVDRSRNGLRRWCIMEECGTMEKTRRRARRRASGV